jgi:hypothetical protein
MADGVTVATGNNSTPPNGTTFATDDTAQGHVPLVKLAYSTDGVSTAVTADVNGLQVQGTTTVTGLTVSSTNATVNIGDATSSTEVIAANANRKGWVLTNMSSAVCYVKMGTGASATSFHKRLEQYKDCGQKIMDGDLYTGAIHAIWASDAGGTIVGGDW